VRVAQDRNPCLTFADIEKKSMSNYMKKGEVLKSTHGFILESIKLWNQQNCGAVPTVKVADHI
jgi:hypothetical protein